MVLVALDHPLHAVEEQRLPGGIVRQAIAGVVAVVVRLDVGFVDHVQPEPIAEPVPLGRVRVVGRAHGVHVELLHERDVTHHEVVRHVLPTLGIDLVAVGALDQNRLPVDEQAAVPDFHLAEADERGNDLEHRAGPVLQRQEQLVEHR